MDKKLFYKSTEIKYIILYAAALVLFLLCAFHSNVWFDESYTVRLLDKSLPEICAITAKDVHPPLYYIILKFFTFIFGGSIIAMRLFSVIGSMLFAMLGYTHIRKLFDDRIGLLFSFFAAFLPQLGKYSNEIRMYSWAALFVALSAIYAYKITKEDRRANWLLFVLFSIFSAYTHYYALLAVAVINLLLFVYILRTKAIKISKWWLAAVSEVVLYIPWIVFFISQMLTVMEGYWISLNYLTILFETFGNIFQGSLPNLAVCALACIVLAFCLYIAFKERKDIKYCNELRLSVVIYLAVLMIGLAVSLKRPIFTPRYMITAAGMFVFALAVITAGSKSKHVIYGICSVVLVFSLVNCGIRINECYSAGNDAFKEVVEERPAGDNIFIHTEVQSMGVMSVELPQCKHYFVNKDHWSVSAYEAYKVNVDFVEDMSFLNRYKDFDGNIWFVEYKDRESYYDEYMRNNKNCSYIEEAISCRIPYSGNQFYLSLVKISG